MYIMQTVQLGMFFCFLFHQVTAALI